MVAAPRKPSKKNTSFAGRYDFGASLKAATRSNQRRPLRRMTSSEDDDNNNNNNSSNQDSTSALSRAISVSKPLTSSNSSPVVNSSPIVTATANSNHSVNSSLTGPALPWSRSHSPSATITTTTSITSSSTTTTTGSNSNFMMATTTNPASLVSPVFSNKSVMNQFATSPSYTSSHCYYCTLFIDTLHSMMMASYATSPNFGGGSFGFYGQPQQSHLRHHHHHHPYDTSAALASPKTSASFFRTSHGFYPASNQNSPMTNGNTTTNNVHRRNSNHSTLPFSDSPLPSPSTTPLPWIRG
ncbi:hypothetical protein BDF22DRAFT_741191 [Syncephalis plumigaleata]|nr:hypothetical protein BDF22DRAFT_741191 [Syncephalis plumigaleata]